MAYLVKGKKKTHFNINAQKMVRFHMKTIREILLFLFFILFLIVGPWSEWVGEYRQYVYYSQVFLFFNYIFRIV